jgi:hypothetical protein
MRPASNATGTVNASGLGLGPREGGRVTPGHGGGWRTAVRVRTVLVLHR